MHIYKRKHNKRKREGEAAFKANVCQVVVLFHCSTSGGSNISKNVAMQQQTFKTLKIFLTTIYILVYILKSLLWTYTHTVNLMVVLSPLPTLHPHIQTLVWYLDKIGFGYQGGENADTGQKEGNHESV